jgi:hypothetical protein
VGSPILWPPAATASRVGVAADVSTPWKPNVDLLRDGHWLAVCPAGGSDRAGSGLYAGRAERRADADTGPVMAGGADAKPSAQGRAGRWRSWDGSAHGPALRAACAGRRSPDAGRRGSQPPNGVALCPRSQPDDPAAAAARRRVAALGAPPDRPVAEPAHEFLTLELERAIGYECPRLRMVANGKGHASLYVHATTVTAIALPPAVVTFLLEQLADLPAAEIQDGVPVSVVRLLGPM